MIPEKPTISPQAWPMMERIQLPLEAGYSIQIELYSSDPVVILFDAGNEVVYRQPWRTDAIRNCMDAMVRDECVTQSKGDET